MKSKSRKVLEILTVFGTAALFFSVSFLTAKWLVLDCGLVPQVPGVGNDILIGALTFLGGGLPAAMILALFDRRSGVGLALFVAPLALLFMAMHGFLFMLFIHVSYWLFGLLVYGGFVGLVALLAAIKRCLCADCCRCDL